MQENSINIGQVTSSPSGFVECAFDKTISLKSTDLERAWNTLNLRETFVDSQFFPYKVEFDSDSQKGPFKKGELNIHHGPLLSVHGEIGEVTNTYRDLQYKYGSYVLSFRLVRPTRLEFFKTETGIRLKLHVYIKPWFKPIWIIGNKLFWSLFKV